jgi:hypothetical protein
MMNPYDYESQVRWKKDEAKALGDAYQQTAHLRRPRRRNPLAGLFAALAGRKRPQATETPSGDSLANVVK